MTDINDLRERVEAAEQRFGLMDEQQRHYSERVIGLIETIETQLQAARSEIEKQIDENLSLSQDLAAARGEIAQHIDENQRLGQENEELRRMLHSVLRSIEQKTHRSDEHPSELQSLMRTSYAVFCLQQQQKNTH